MSTSKGVIPGPLAAALALALCGCEAETEPVGSQETPTATGNVAEAAAAPVRTSCATSAAYFTPPFGNDRNMVRIMGQNMKLGAGIADIQSFGRDAANQDSPVSSARAIRPGGNGVQYEAELSHRAAWDRTFVRIRCGGGNNWSDWVRATK